ncbi:hypothetical protein ACI6QG_02420 [Roseococcus sp. DSY-14]|uniref:hypothetical protein n=1 Tax=Roseococcus sp. DSY-14 TaxID=3369650 RepID=UPI00387B2CC3
MRALAAALLLLAAPAAAQPADSRCRGALQAEPFARMEGIFGFTYFLRLTNRSEAPRRWTVELRGVPGRVEPRQSGGPIPPGGSVLVRLGEGNIPDVQGVALRWDEAGLETGPLLLLRGCAAERRPEETRPTLPGDPPAASPEEALLRQMLGR